MIAGAPEPKVVEKCADRKAQDSQRPMTSIGEPR